MKYTLITIAAYAAAVAGHGIVTSPPPRGTGPEMEKTCGKAAIDAVGKDPTIPLENFQSPPAECNVFLCRGAKFEDNQANVQNFKPNQTVNFKVDLPIPHEGPANVSIVDTARNKVIGDPLIFFDSYADEKLPQLPANNTDFNVTMPQLKQGQCSKPGACVLQWFWFGTEAKQTYESCVDFVMDE
ncbi:hypothetical protein XA68_16662 [Ophiocordyceps unilateralis]|uniref:Chitin-binding type-4 domain-containing protein n=1 Tax=Ophiocordyceps unilateralis TaxID=268505 RepID=A0A2A9PSX6_OPHUN|nr:hypothetical protein XA68_16662 [Ophiocordyceps unilateralis]